MRVLIACESSGVVRRAFRERGHDAWSCDILAAEDQSRFHYQCDVRLLLSEEWDLVIAHPPCTRLTNSGVRWLHERNLWNEMREGAAFFNLFKGCAPRVAIENPVMHRYARALCDPFTQSLQPWQHGEPQFKRIGLWLENLPPLVDTNRLVPPKPGTPEHKAWSKVHRASPGPDRWRERSRFFPGVAAAMAEQWGGLT